MPPKKFKTKKPRNSAAEALARLRARWEEDNENEEWEPENEPVVTPMLKAVPGGIKLVLDALRSHDEDDARDFFEVYERCSESDRKLLSLESIAFAAGIGSLRLAEVAQTALYLYASMQTKMLVSSAMTKVTKSIIKAATDEMPIIALDPETKMSMVVGRTNGDVKAMELFGRMAGIVPVPKGAQIAIQNNYGEQKELDKPSPGGSWRSAEDRLREIHDATEPKRLPSPPSPPISIGGHIDEMQLQTVEIIRG